jgi:hypothetical protein
MVKPKDNSKCSSSTSKARSSYERVGHNLISKYHNTNYKRRKTWKNSMDGSNME